MLLAACLSPSLLLHPVNVEKKQFNSNFGSDSCVVAVKGIIAGVSLKYIGASLGCLIWGWEVINDLYIGGMSALLVHI